MRSIPWKQSLHMIQSVTINCIAYKNTCKNATTYYVDKFTGNRAMMPTACWWGRLMGGSWSLWGLAFFPRALPFLLLNQLFHTQLHTLLEPSLT